MTQFRTNQNGNKHPITPKKSNKIEYKPPKEPKNFRKVEYDTFEERYFDCPKCGNMISDHSNAPIALDSEKTVNIEKGQECRCPNCKTRIRITGG